MSDEIVNVTSAQGPSILLCGDLILAGRPSDWINFNRSPYSDELDNFVVNSDLVFANLELPFSNFYKPMPTRPTHKVPMETADRLNRFHLDVVSLANNHILDWGREGLQVTFEKLNQSKYFLCGCWTFRRGGEGSIYDRKKIISPSGYWLMRICMEFP